MTWGNSNNYGQLNWDGDYALISGQSGKGIKLRTNGSGVALTIDTSQRVGIGTTTPTEKLQVTGNISASGTIIAKTSKIIENFTIETNVGSSGPLMMFGSNSDTDSFMTFGAYGSINNLDTAGRDFHLYGTNTTTGFYFDESAGKFGIGTTSPGEKLEVVGNISASGDIEASTFTAAGNVDFNGDLDVDGTTNLDGLVIDGSVNISAGKTINFAALFLQDAAGGRIGFNRNTSNGNIHDASFNAYQVQNNTANGSFEIQAYSGSNGGYGGSFFINKIAQPVINDYIVHNGDTNTFLGFPAADTFKIQTGGTDRLTVTNGNVGIGTTSPPEKLTVTGDISASGDINIKNNSQFKGKHTNGSEYGLLTLTSGNVIKVGGYDYTSAGVIFGGGDNTQFNIGTTEVMKMRSTGLDVTGQITASGNIKSAGNVIANNVFLPGAGIISFDDSLDGTDQFIKGDDHTMVIDADDILRIKADTAVQFASNNNTTFVSIDTNAGHISSSGGNLTSNRKFPQSQTPANNLGTGDIIYVGGGSTTLGDIVYMRTNGQWASAKADDVSTSTPLLGIALGTDPDVDGVLLRGTYTLDHDVGDNQGIPLYLSDGTAGQATTTIPDTSGDIVRIIGYNLGDANEIWFSPDNTFVEVA